MIQSSLDTTRFPSDKAYLMRRYCDVFDVDCEAVVDVSCPHDTLMSPDCGYDTVKINIEEMM